MGNLICFFFDSYISKKQWYDDAILDRLLNHPIEDFIAVKEIINKNYEREFKIRDLCSEWRTAEGYGHHKAKAKLIRIARRICPSINKRKIASLKNEIKELENSRPQEWKEIIEPYITKTATDFKNRYKTTDCEAALYAYACVYSRINEINNFIDPYIPKNIS